MAMDSDQAVVRSVSICPFDDIRTFTMVNAYDGALGSSSCKVSCDCTTAAAHVDDFGIWLDIGNETGRIILHVAGFKEALKVLPRVGHDCEGME